MLSVGFFKLNIATNRFLQEIEIKKLAKAGHKDACIVLAKQLVALRKQKTKNINMGANISSVGSKNKLVAFLRFGDT